MLEDLKQSNAALLQDCILMPGGFSSVRHRLKQDLSVGVLITHKSSCKISILMALFS